MKKVLEGKVTKFVSRVSSGTETDTTIKFSAEIEDPLGYVDQVAVLYGVKPEGMKPLKPGKSGKYKALRVAGRKMKKLERGRLTFKNDVRVEGEKMVTYLMQIATKQKDGSTSYYKPIELDVGFGADRKTVKAELFGGADNNIEVVENDKRRPEAGERWKGGGGEGRFNAPELRDGLTQIPLPGTISNVVQGGGGQYLIIHIEERRKLAIFDTAKGCLLYTSPSPRDRTRSRMPSSA